MEYKIIRSDRKTLGIGISSEGEVLVRAPRFLSEERISVEVSKAEDWIKGALERYEKRKNSAMTVTLSHEEERLLKRKAYEVLPAIVDLYSRRMNVSPTGIKVTSAKTRFGSCSSNNSLCFSFRIMLYPQSAIEAVVVHELAHIKYKDHGKMFYNFIYSVMPDYDERKKLLTL